MRGGVAAWLAARQSPARPPTPPKGDLGLDRPGGRDASRPDRGGGGGGPGPAKAGGGRSPSTVRRQLGQAERALTAATATRDALVAELGSALDHREMAALGERLSAAQHSVDAAEESWLALATEAENLGLDL